MPPEGQNAVKDNGDPARKTVLAARARSSYTGWSEPSSPDWPTLNATFIKLPLAGYSSMFPCVLHVEWRCRTQEIIL